MTESAGKLPDHVEWQLTTTTIWCPEVALRVALIVKGDWTAYCCWFREKKEGQAGGKVNRCLGDGCPHVLEYRDKLVMEERS